MKRKLTLFGAIFLFIGVAAFGGGAVDAVRTSAFLERASRAEGVVIRLGERPGQKRRVVYYPIVRFVDAEGRSWTFHESQGSNPALYEVGERVKVLYDPALPRKARIHTFLRLWALPAILCVVGLVFAGVGAAVLRRNGILRRRRERLLATGQRISARVLGARQDETFRFNGQSPWRIQAEWASPYDNRTYRFESDNLWFDPTPHLHMREIGVFIEPENPKHYAMDTSFLPGEGR